MRRTRRPGGPRKGATALIASACLAALAGPAAAAEVGPFELTLRSRVEAPGLGGAYRVVEAKASWDPKRTALIVCDMWDLHHCLNATRRVGQLAPRMNEVLKAARARGATIIHAPSDCMAAYKDHPARLRATSAPRSKSLPDGIGQWCKRIPAEERDAYPVDQTDGGEDDDPAEHARWQARLAASGRNPKAPWKSETSALAIDPDLDFISDNGEEIWSVLEARGVDNVILMGVHLNMCVLGRPFGLRQMAKNGKNVALMRDMTDTMYNPLKAPFVSHFSGTDRVVEHVERFVSPSVTSDQVLGGKPFRFPGDRRPTVAFLIAEDEYKTETTLPPFASAYLARDTRLAFVFDRADDKDALTGLAALDDADVLVVSARRRLFPADQLAAVRRFVASGRGVVGLRTASHAFAARDNAAPPDGRDAWPGFDADVLGGHYTGHHKVGPTVALSVAPEAREGHPILNGLAAVGSPGQPTIVGHGSLYKVSPLAASATPLLTGVIPDEPTEPVLWTNLAATGGRVVYTSLGHPDDFKQPAFLHLLRNAVDWAAHRDPSAALEAVSSAPIPFP